MFGWFSAARISRSLAIRSASPAPVHAPRGSLSATGRLSMPSARSASQTAPIPPSASLRTTRYGPIVSGGGASVVARPGSHAAGIHFGNRPQEGVVGTSSLRTAGAGGAVEWSRARAAARRSSAPARAAAARAPRPASRSARPIPRSPGRARTCPAYASASRRSMRAFCQSRRTVRSVTESACAISGSVMPPKYRISTTCDRRGSTAAMRSSAWCTSQDLALLRRRRPRCSTSSVTRAAPAAAPRRQAPPREVDDHRAHHADGPSHEVHAVFERDVAGLREADVRLVHERSGVEQRRPAARAQPRAGQPLQVGVGRRIQGVDRLASPCWARWIS